MPKHVDRSRLELQARAAHKWGEGWRTGPELSRREPFHDVHGAATNGTVPVDG
jgi:hypothetical protein